MRRRILSKEDSVEEAAINLTPLIDVVFVVLIMFILVAPILELDRVELAEGIKENKKEFSPAKSSIAIHVHADGQIWLNGRPLSLLELQKELQVLQRQFPHAIPQLFHDKKASFGSYQSIKNAVERAGFEQLDVVLTP